MGCAADVFKKIFLWILSLIKVGVSVAIIVIVFYKLYNVTWLDDGTVASDSCLMEVNTSSSDLCYYAWAVAGASLLASLLISILLCCTCNLCGVGGLIEMILAIASTVWWVIAAIIFTRNGSDANDADVPEEGARTAVFVLSWVNAGLFGVAALVCLVDAIKCLKNCLCCCCDKDGGKYSA